MPSSAYSLFSRFGVELEYMIVDAQSHNIVPVADELLKLAAGEIVEDFIHGSIGLCNELALHVIEMRNHTPVQTLQGLAQQFQDEVFFINELLSLRGWQLMPTAMHPWMSPHTETRLWPHGNRDIYEAFNSVFDCRGHGWSNLQSTHLNIAFSGDEEFARLHSAIRLLLPLLPALAASSPYCDGIRGSHMDMRLHHYRGNCARIPSVTGHVIPEPVSSHAEYNEVIFQPMYAAIAPLDPSGILQDEWLNARGAITRFDRGSIEIRVLDIQECPKQDLAIVECTIAILKQLVAHGNLEKQLNVATEELKSVLLATMNTGSVTPIRSRALLDALGYLPNDTPTARDLWHHLISLLPEDTHSADWREGVAFILENGTLAERLTRRLGTNPTQQVLHSVYRRLAENLAKGERFEQ